MVFISWHPHNTRAFNDSNWDKCNLCPAPCATTINPSFDIPSLFGNATTDKVTPGAHSST